jgi:hypothetical protein
MPNGCRQESVFLVSMFAVVAIAQIPADPQKPRLAEESLTFDVASVKPYQPGKGGRAGGSPMIEPGRLYPGAPNLKGLLMDAYGVKDFRL